MNKSTNIIKVNGRFTEIKDEPKENGLEKPKAYSLGEKGGIEYDLFQQMMDLVNNNMDFLWGPEKSAIVQFIIKNSKQIIDILQNNKFKRLNGG